MTRTSVLGFVGLVATILAGCPIYSGNGNTGGSSTSNPGGCNSSLQCQENEVCGQDGQCHSGDCTLWGCSAGFSCQVDPNTQTASCQPDGSTTGTGGKGTGGTGGGSTTSTTSGTGGSMPVYCGHPSDCMAGETCGTDGTCHTGDCTKVTCIFGYVCDTVDGTCKSPTAGACDKDSDCMAGSLCVAGPKGGGVCTTAANQCFDQSQCDAGDKCVSGKCIKACAMDTDCRDGYLCDTTHGVCSTPGKTCTVTNDCGGPDKVCVGGVCVPRAGNNGMCMSGDVWDENGCIPNQAATFTCVTDGMQDACATGSICLHHSCWISCDMSTMQPCSGLSTGFTTCKPVDDSGTSYNVCGSSSNLGSDCGAGAGNKMCTGAGQVCIDGFCK